MLTSPDAESVGNSPVDTGWNKFSKATPPYLDAAIAADCRADIATMREQSRVDAERADQLIADANALYARVYERQHFIREYTDFLQAHGRAVS